VIAVQTTNATPSSSVIATPLTNTLIYAEVTMIARDSAGANFAKYNRTMLAHRAGGGATSDQMSVVGTDFESSAGLDGTLAVSGNDIVAQVTGLAATTIDWIITGYYITVP